MGERGLAPSTRIIRAWLEITRGREREKLILINEGNRGGIVGEGSRRRRRRKCAAHANSAPQSQCLPTLRIYILPLPSLSLARALNPEPFVRRGMSINFLSVEHE